MIGEPPGQLTPFASGGNSKETERPKPIAATSSIRLLFMMSDLLLWNEPAPIEWFSCLGSEGPCRC